MNQFYLIRDNQVEFSIGVISNYQKFRCGSNRAVSDEIFEEKRFIFGFYTSKRASLGLVKDFSIMH